MKFEKPLKIFVGCQDDLTDEKLCEMICDALLDGFLPKEFKAGSTIRVFVNLEFSIPDYDLS